MCSGEYVLTVDRCPDCGVALSADPPPPEPPPDHGVVKFDLSSLDGDQRQVLTTLLVERGIRYELTLDGSLTVSAERRRATEDAIQWLQADITVGGPEPADQQDADELFAAHPSAGAVVSREWWGRILVSAPAWGLAWLSFARVWVASDDGLSFLPLGLIPAMLCWLYVWVNRKRLPDLKYAAGLAALGACYSVLMTVIG